MIIWFYVNIYDLTDYRIAPTVVEPGYIYVSF